MNKEKVQIFYLFFLLLDFPNENKNYSLLDLFEEDSKLVYNDIVLDKMKFDKNNEIDVIDEKNNLNNKIYDLVSKKFNKREIVKYELNNQTKLLLSIFGIEEDNNKHFLSSKNLYK